jgi:syntaxin 5
MLPMPAPSFGSVGSVAGPIHGGAPAAMPAFNPFGQQPAPVGDKKDDDYAGTADGERQAAQYARQTFAQRRRAVDMQNVESTISELSQMFGKVASLVAEQGEVVNRIDDDMDVAGLNVQAGQNELLKYYSNLSGERQLIIKLLLVTCCLGAFFIYWWR